MNHVKVIFISILTGLLVSLNSPGREKPKAVTPGISPEAEALLQLFYDISGKYILTGQHNYPNTRDRNTQFTRLYTGKTPVIWSTDWGFAEDGDTDSYLARPDIVEEAIRQHKKGSIITICWHAVPPTAEEPVTFRPLPGAPGDTLKSIQGQLTDRQFMDVLTPGTELYIRWCRQVDSVAVYLKKLQDAKVPVLWRPYHEMNGSWFWWGGRHGIYSSAALYRQLFDRLVNVHRLNNLVWVWNADRPNKPEMSFKHFFPGNTYLDILSLDVYGNDYKQSYYDSLVYLSQGKPVLLGEVGNPPSPDILDHQPLWTAYVVWAGMARNILQKDYEQLYGDRRWLNLEDDIYKNVSLSYRQMCGLPPLSAMKDIPLDLSGLWILNEEKSRLEGSAPRLPYKLEIQQAPSEIIIKSTTILEFADSKTTEEKFTLDSSYSVTEFMHSVKTTTATFSEKKDSLLLNSVIRNDRDHDIVINQVLFLRNNLKELVIKQYTRSLRGEQDVEMVFDKVWN